MGRLHARVTTGTGDSGYTSLLGKERVPKYEPRIEALGTMDEASSALGLARATCHNQRVKETIYNLQKDLYTTMAEVATPPANYDKIPFKVGLADVQRLERLADDLKGQVEIENVFIVPGDTPGGAALDLARTVVRRAERQVALLLHDGAIPNREVLRLLNRMSDLVFILARYEEADAKLWSARQTA